MKKQSDFATKGEFLSYLVSNKRELIELKKAAIKFTDNFGMQSNAVGKVLQTNNTDDIASGIIKRTIIANTYNWMDSHSDIHADGVFAKTISERQDKIFHLHDHEQKITAKVGKPTSIYEKSVSWADMEVNYPGKTMALFMESDIVKEYNPVVFRQYLAKEINQHSVGMIYVKIDLAVNDPEQKPEYAVWSKVINSIGNRKRAEDQGYFWYVTEAKLIEISAVLSGSNELTPTIDNKEKSIAGPATEPNTKVIDYKYLVNNFKQVQA